MSARSHKGPGGHRGLKARESKAGGLVGHVVSKAGESEAGGRASGSWGFTLIELLVVLAVIGIVILVSANYMTAVIPKWRLDSTSKDMLARIRAAQMLSVLRNKVITVSGDSTGYWAFIDTNTLGVYDGGDQYFNVDSGRPSTQALATKSLETNVTVYTAYYGMANGLIFKPPSGLPEAIINAGGAYVTGVICMQVQVTDDSYDSRRITIDPLVGKTKLQKNKDPVTTADSPDCFDDSEWEDAV